MKTRNGMRIISVLMTLLLVSAMAMPAMACEPKQPISEISKEEENKIVNEILDYKETKQVKDILDELDFEVDWSNAVLTKADDGYMLSAFLSPKPVSLSNIKGISLIYDGSEVKDVVLMESSKITNGVAFRISSMFNKDESIDAMLVKDNTGNARLQVQNLQTGEITSLDLSCEDLCENVVSIGCSIGAVLVCGAICGPAVPCLLVCGILYGLICTNSQGTDCDYLCSIV